MGGGLAGLGSSELGLGLNGLGTGTDVIYGGIAAKFKAAIKTGVKGHLHTGEILNLTLNQML